jgi:hypothetical protein
MHADQGPPPRSLFSSCTLPPFLGCMPLIPRIACLPWPCICATRRLCARCAAFILTWVLLLWPYMTDGLTD